MESCSGLLILQFHPWGFLSPLSNLPSPPRQLSSKCFLQDMQLVSVLSAYSSGKHVLK